MKTIKFLLVAVLTLASGFSSCSSDDDDVVKSSEKAITQFKAGQVVGTIDEKAKTIDMLFPFGSDLTKIKPEVSISKHASVNPKSGTEVNLSKPVEYVVTAEDGTTSKYTVTAKVALSSEAKITAFDLGEGDKKIVGTIDEAKKTISLTIPFTPTSSSHT